MDVGNQIVRASGDQSRALAHVLDSKDAGFDLLVVFHLGDQEYGLFASKVREIIRRKPTTRVPNSSSIIEGVINLRGSIIPVFNLRRCLGDTTDCDEATCNLVAMIVEINDTEAGLLVDEVSDVVKVSEKDIDLTSRQVESSSDKQIIEGTVKLPGRLITLLKLDTMLEAEHAKSN